MIWSISSGGSVMSAACWCCSDDMIVCGKVVRSCRTGISCRLEYDIDKNERFNCPI